MCQRGGGYAGIPYRLYAENRAKEAERKSSEGLAGAFDSLYDNTLGQVTKELARGIGMKSEDLEGMFNAKALTHEMLSFSDKVRNGEDIKSAAFTTAAGTYKATAGKVTQAIARNIDGVDAQTLDAIVITATVTYFTAGTGGAILGSALSAMTRCGRPESKALSPQG